MEWKNKALHLLITFVTLLFSFTVLADDSPTNTASPYLDSTPPVQQFVTSEPDQQPEVVSSQPLPEPLPAPYAPGQLGPIPSIPSIPAEEGNAPPPPVPSPSPTPQALPPEQLHTPAIPTTNLPIPAATPSVPGSLPNPPTAGTPAPLPVPIPTYAPIPISTVPPVTGAGVAQAQSLPLPDKSQPQMTGNGQPPPPVPAPELSADEIMLASRKPLEVFAGGLNQNSFVQCAKMAASVCSLAPNKDKYLICLNQLKQQKACEQFLTFAALSQFNIKDDMDVFQRYNQASLFLIHIARGNMGNYPGDYYIISDSGYFVDINKGPEAQLLDITKNSRFPEIAQRYPRVQLWSIVNKLPVTEPLVAGAGLRFIFPFEMMNGCDTCGRVGFAYVAYDFGPDGVLNNTEVLSLEEAAIPAAGY